MRVHPLRHRHPRNLHPVLLLPRILPETPPQHPRLPALRVRLNVLCHSWRLAFSHILHRKPIEVLRNPRRKPPRIDILGLRDLHHHHPIPPNRKQKHPTPGSAQSQNLLHPVPLHIWHRHLPHLHVTQISLLRIECEQANDERL